MAPTTASSQTDPGSLLEVIDDALAAAIDQPWMSADRNEVRAALQRLPGLRNRLDALAGLVTQTAALLGATGAKRVDQFMGAESNETPAQVRHDLRTAHWLADFAGFRSAFERGDLSRRHVDLLRRADEPSTHWAMLRDQAELVTFARDCTFDGFGTALQYWVNAVDPDGRMPDEQVRRNDVRLVRHKDGSVTGKLRLDPLLGTAVHEALEREAQKLWHDDDEHGVKRHEGQRRAAALAGLVSRGAARDDGTFPSPLINVVMSEQVHERLLEAVDDPTVDLGLDAHDIDGRCEFIDGTPLHPRLALALVGVGVFRRHVLDARSRPIDVSVNARSFPQWMKDAALISTRGRCSTKGCDGRFHWLHGDHTVPHSKGGPTRLHNLRPMCGPDNRAKGDRLPAA
ncbi:MAG: HNH endonuclease [Actinomycetota bacterium]